MTTQSITRSPEALLNGTKAWVCVNDSVPSRAQNTFGHFFGVTVSGYSVNLVVNQLAVEVLDAAVVTDLKIKSQNQSITTQRKVQPRKAGVGLEKLLSAQGDAEAKIRKARILLAEEFFPVDRHSLKKVRLLKGLSQKEVAAAMGTTQPHYSKIEAGLVSPNVETLKKIASVLCIDIDLASRLVSGPQEKD